MNPVLPPPDGIPVSPRRARSSHVFGLLSLLAVTLLPMSNDTHAALPTPLPANHDESKVVAYTLPDALTATDGSKIRSTRAWKEKRRGEIFRQFEVEMYGRMPGRPRYSSYEVFDVDKAALGGKAVRKQVSVWFTQDRTGPRMDILIYQPAQGPGPFPVFLGLNFEGNHAVRAEKGIRLSTAWMRNNKEKGIVDNKAGEATRGSESSRWAVEEILSRGYALATIYYGDIDPDYDDGFQNGVHPLFYKEGQTRPAPDEWGSISAWAWGLSRALDYLETDRDYDPRKVAVMGHSRLGKTALWAGATDERFAIVISNNSGCGGAALNRRNFGESVDRINHSFPHWFCDNFKKYGNNESALPMDQHQLIALMAPRPVYVASAKEDLWADPRGEFLATKHAESVYGLFGRIGLGVAEMPPVDHPVGENLGYHIRTGKHDVTDYDWHAYLNFADKHFGRPSK